MREESEMPHKIQVWLGITPAHAGRILRRRRKKNYVGDHPRACGKNFSWEYRPFSDIGSPPRMREECIAIALAKNGTGITPAHAGRIFYSRWSRIRPRDHPRACGKNAWRSASPRICKGSPPRMREEFYCASASSMFGGITPAHAGRIRASL